jgi:3-(3-hydroxy-phenyl)propionate hydroxylase
MKHNVPVVIIGAGPTGVTAATMLAQYGIKCLVLDRWQDVYPQPRAVHMDDEVCRIIARLGIQEEFAAISRPAHGLRLVDRNMRVLAEFRRDSARSVNGFAQANMFDQPELEALLRANLKKYSCAQLRVNSEAISVTQDDTSSVTVEFTDRINGQRHAVTADYVLGCDGANSKVRSAIGSSMEDLNFEQRWLVIDVATTARLDQWDGAHQVCDPVRAATYMRIGEARYRWEFRLLDGETAADYSAIADVRPLIGPWVQGIPTDQLELVRAAEYTFRAQVAAHWRDRNVFILGDAAHLTPPFVGQGMGAGIRDAMNLAWKLAGVLNGDLSAAVLDSYEQERKPHTREMIRQALGMGKAMTAGGELGNVVRAVVVPHIRLIPGMRSKLVGSSSPGLSRSAMVSKKPGVRQLAGTLCPNPELSQGVRLDDIAGNRFTLITTSTPSRPQHDDARRRGAVVVMAEPGSALASWLRRGHAAAAIVRPDRTVMLADRRLAPLCAALPEFHSATAIPASA